MSFLFLLLFPLVLAGLLVAAVFAFLFPLIGFVITLPFRILGVVFTMLGWLIALPFLLIGGLLALVGLLVGGIVGGAVFLVPFVPIALFALLVIGLVRLATRRPSHA